METKICRSIKIFLVNNSNQVSINSLDHPRDVSRLISLLYRIVQQKGFEEVYLDMHSVARAFPNACVPFAAVINYYRHQGIEIKLNNLPTLLKNAHVDDTLRAEKLVVQNAGDALSKVWRFNDAQGVSVLTSAYVQCLAEKIECSQGVLEAFEWCINEIMDNVLQHSGEQQGLIMVQVHSESRRVAICLTDTGIGIYGSLKHSIYRPKNAVDAITMALKEGVTRSSKEHQGNGLWGLLEIVSENEGSLTVTSGSGSVFYRQGGQVLTFDRLPFLDRTHQGTIVDFQLKTDTIVDISKALGGHNPINLRLDSIEGEDGEHYICVKEHAHGTGTRIAAQQLRNLIVNTINQGVSRVIVDFQGIGVISSSFADELIGKLVVRFGFFNFQQIIQLKNMTDTVQVILHRSVAQRMMESLQQRVDDDSGATD